MQNLEKKLFRLVTSLFKNQKFKTDEIDFNKSWLQLVIKHKWEYSYILIASFLETSFLTLLPFFISNAINKHSYTLVLYILLGGVTVSFLRGFAWVLDNNLSNQNMKSISVNATQFFLTVDPIFHSTRSSGQIISKLNRAENAINQIDFIFSADLFPMFVGVVVVWANLLWQNLTLGFISVVAILIIIFINIFMRIVANNAFKKSIVSSEDISKAVGLESIQQVQFVRTNFATNEQVLRLSKVNSAAGILNRDYWNTSAIGDSLIQALYFTSVGFLSFYVLFLVNSDKLSIVSGIAMVVTYISGTSRITEVGSRVKRFLEADYAVRDLFQFIRSFGKQTYPVLETETPSALRAPSSQEGQNSLKHNGL